MHIVNNMIVGYVSGGEKTLKSGLSGRGSTLGS